MEIKDALGLGKVLPIDKLIDVIVKGTGRLTKNYFDRKDVAIKAFEINEIAKARAEEIKTISSAIKENYLLTVGIQYNDSSVSISSPKETCAPSAVNSLQQRAIERTAFQDILKQQNIESVTTYAAEELKNESVISSESLDNDWITRFFSIIQDISDEKMQILWAKVLTGEIKKPKSYSLRTLELLKNLSKDEAELILRVAKYSLSDSKLSFIFEFNRNEKYKLNYEDIILLEELGVVSANRQDFIIPGANEKENEKYLIAGDLYINIVNFLGTSSKSLKILVFTKTGHELLKVINTNPEFPYIQSISYTFRSIGVNSKYAKIKKIENNIVFHDGLKDIPIL